MDGVIIAIVAVVAIMVGIGGGYLVRNAALNRGVGAATSSAARILQDAETESKRLVMEGKEEAIQNRAAAETEVRERRREVQRSEDRVAGRDESLDRRQQGLEQKEQNVAAKDRQVDEMKAEVEDLKQQEVKVLESVAALSISEAQEQIMRKAEDVGKHDLAKRYYEMEQVMLSEADDKARTIIAQSIQRLAAEVVSETTTSTVPLPNDEMKGRLIGREGRNIRAIEAATGVDLIIDDTPEAVTISCFDPIRREVAKIALARLIQDGRIHPARVEETVTKAQEEVEETIRRSGEQAVLDSGVRGLHPDLIKLLGRLNYRYSYGENVLQHSVEVARLAGLVAGELKCNVQVAKAGGLLHDIGKALTHESEGSHIELGDEVAKRYGLSEAVRAAVVEHHDDDRGTPEAFVVAAADAMSAARPGARRDTVEFYIKRLEALEDVANSFSGVERSFAIQAGREVRILVQPDEIDDIGAANLAHDVVKKIEENLVYPGHIKVTVVRETRATEVAK
jgi:ribonuclease Y